MVDIKKEFRGGDKKLVKIAELKRIKQWGRINKRVCARISKSKQEKVDMRGRPLIEKFKRGINGDSPSKTNGVRTVAYLDWQWYDRVIALDRNLERE